MTVLNWQDTDEGTKLPPPKKRRLSSNIRKADTGLSIQNWLASSSQLKSSPMPVSSDMVNGYSYGDSYDQNQYYRNPDDNGYAESVPPVTPLFNLGNTCFLNSVLYTLRFAPSFLHKLHHLNMDSMSFAKQINSAKDKAYSLGRSQANSSSCCNKELYTYNTTYEIKIQNVISKLHQLYANLWHNEMKDRVEPFQPNVFLQALRDVNQIFEGNQQHDAHELLVCLVDIIREACEVVYQQHTILDQAPSRPPVADSPPPVSTGAAITSKVKRKWKKLIRSEKGSPNAEDNSADEDVRNVLVNGDVHFNSNTIFEDFQGVSLLQTTCLECEKVNERKETFCDICVPVQTGNDDDDEFTINKLYQSVLVTEEYLVDCNKYWCDHCARLNEAKRCVRYEKLPRLLTLHLKRFSSNFGTSVSKVNDYMPTPFKLYCFCEECLSIENPRDRPHLYHLYAIIMHLGPTIASGHYIAYVRSVNSANDYLYCAKDKPKTASLSRGSNLAAFANSADKQKKIMNYFNSKLSSKSFSNGSPSSISKEPNETKERIRPSCKALDCCSVRLRTLSPAEEGGATVWLECDDESIRPLSMENVMDMLRPSVDKCSTSTPYLLFYARMDG